MINTQSPVEIVSRLCEGLNREERTKILNSELDSVQRQLEHTLYNIEKVKKKITDTIIKYEDMNDVIKTMDQLKNSLEEHIKTVRLNESSFTGTSAVLEYDTAKGRTSKLIHVIKARTQWERSKEALQEGGKDEHQKLYESLAEMQSSYEILSKFVSKSFDSKELEESKDRYLAWQSAALIFAIQQADFEKLSKVQKAYESLGRMEEFISVFRRISINRLKEFIPDKSSSELVIDSLYKEIDFIYKHHYRVLRRFIDDKEASSIILNAIEDGLYDLDLCNLFSDLIGEEENPIYLLQKIAKVLSSHHEDFSQYDSLNDNFSVKLNHRIVQELIAPFRGALTTCVLSKINTIDLKSGSFRSRVESFKTSIAELIHLIQDVFHYSEGVFGNKVIQVVQHPIDKAIDNFLAKLRGWQYWLDSQKKPRTLDDMISLCAASGQLIFGLQELKNMVETVDASLSLNIKPAFKWNRGVCDHVLKTAYENVSLKMTARMAEIRDATPTELCSANLPSFSTSPHEYVTTAGQELLHLFNRWEQFFLNEYVSYAFHVAFKKKYEGDELFKKTVGDVANRVIIEFIGAIKDPHALTLESAKQFLADTVFLKDAFEDLRTGNVESLSALEDKLRSVVNS